MALRFPLLPVLSLVLSLLPAVSGAAEPAQQRMLVKVRAGAAQAREESRDFAPALARRNALRLLRSGQIADRMHVLQFDLDATGESQAQVMARLRADPEVEYVQPDRRRFAQGVPNDPLYTSQWYLQAAQPAAIRAEQAWDITTGSPNVVIAILDTGVRFDHPDLQAAAQGGRLLPGYDFVSSVAVANDGDGRDPDPSDPGDWVDDNDKQQTAFKDCDLSPSSSWHGTRVAGIVGARANNAAGIAGTTWLSPILPVRVLGKCGGFDSDIIPAMRWAAGLPVQGLPNNPYPARIINMSLGADGTCSTAYRDVIAELATHGVLVVASAGNDTGHAVSEPADCPGALGVAGLRHIGTKVGFSNIGPEIGVSAPGGNCVSSIGACLYSLDTTYDIGTTTPQAPGYTNQINANLGTSFSAPIVAAVAALVRSMNSHLTPAQTIVRIQQGATPFPRQSGLANCENPATAATTDQLECNCTTSTCGAGMVNAYGAVSAALRPFVIATASPSSPSQGQTVTLDGSDSFAADGRTIASYSWSVVSTATGNDFPAIAGANLASASFTAPAAGVITLRLTITDSEGVQDSADISVTTPTVATPAASNNGGGGGGGGAFLFADLLFLLSLACLRAPRR